MVVTTNKRCKKSCSISNLSQHIFEITRSENEQNEIEKIVMAGR